MRLQEIKGKFVIPSGIVGTCLGTLAKIAREIPQIGILTTKTITLKLKEGNPEPILEQISPLSFINAVGLSNPGAANFKEELRKIYPLPKRKFLMVSIAASDTKELRETIKILTPFFDGIELNISCPHGGKYGFYVGRSKKLIFEFITFAREATKKPIFVKLPPMENIKDTVQIVLEAGVDGISAINTVPVTPNLLCKSGGFEWMLSSGKGGISGKAIKKVGIKCIREIFRITQGGTPIIATGGISQAKDIRLYQRAGADFFGIGSTLAGMNFVKMKEYFKTLEKDLKNNTNFAKKFLLKRKIMNYKSFKIKKIKNVDRNLKIFYFDKPLKSQPGQFVFLNLKKTTTLPPHPPARQKANRPLEKPFSIAFDSPLILAIRKVGDFTSKTFRLKEGDRVFIRGPYGKSFPIWKNKEIYLIAGGTGAVPLYFLARKLKNSTIFLGAKTKKQLLFTKEFSKLGKIILITEDGSKGEKGKVTAALKRYLKKYPSQNPVFYNCGPEPMLKKATKIEQEFTLEKNIFVLLERYMKCGIGLCGHCAINGSRVCIDGPVFDYLSLSKSSHFGKFKRDKTGKLIHI